MLFKDQWLYLYLQPAACSAPRYLSQLGCQSYQTKILNLENFWIFCSDFDEIFHIVLETNSDQAKLWPGIHAPPGSCTDLSDLARDFVLWCGRIFQNFSDADRRTGAWIPYCDSKMWCDKCLFGLEPFLGYNFVWFWSKVSCHDVHMAHKGHLSMPPLHQHHQKLLSGTLQNNFWNTPSTKLGLK